MQTFVALLRGINVGGRNRVPMAELRTLFESLGHQGVATYIQSGNVVFETSQAEDDLVAGIRAAFKNTFGIQSSVVVRSADELAAVAAAHPLGSDDVDPRFLHVAFLSGQPTREVQTSIEPGDFAPDRFQIEGRHIYLHYPNGQGAPG